MATISELENAKTELEALIARNSALGLDVDSLYDSVDEINDRIADLEAEALAEEEAEEDEDYVPSPRVQVEIDDRPVKMVIHVRESGTAVPTKANVHEGDTYYDVVESCGIRSFINGEERKMRTNLGPVEDMMLPVEDGTTILVVSMPKIDGGLN